MGELVELWPDESSSDDGRETLAAEGLTIEEAVEVLCAVPGIWRAEHGAAPTRVTVSIRVEIEAD